MDAAAPLATAEFLVVDTETNGRMGEGCELTEVGAVLVGGAELHDRFASLVAVRGQLRRGIERFTGITRSMLADAPPPRPVLEELAGMLRGRVMVAHAASFDRRVLAQAFERAGLDWPDPPLLCTVSLARRFAPLATQRRLGALAASLGIEVAQVHRALPDAETCARVFCALFPRLCAHAVTVEDALALAGVGGPRSRRARKATREPRLPRRLGELSLATGNHPHPPRAPAGLDALPDAPGVYIFRDAGGRPLYVGKSVSLRTRARAHFAPSSPSADWIAHAELVEHEATGSELGALVLEHRTIKRLRPAGNVRLRKPGDGVYVRCRLDIPFPVLEVAREPASGHAVNVGPLASRAAAVELVEQLTSLYELRHCGRRLPRREHPSAYGQMGRCLSPCLGDLDPNLYRRRLDAALGLFSSGGDGGAALLDHVAAQMRAASRDRRYERAAWLRRRRRRLEVLLGRLGGVLEATHARARLVLASHPDGGRPDAFWLVAGRVVDWGRLPPGPELERRTAAASARAGAPALAGHLPPDEVDELRIVRAWLAAHPETPVLDLGDAGDGPQLERFVCGVGGAELVGEPVVAATS